MIKPLQFQNATMYRYCDTLGFHITIWKDWWFRLKKGCRPIFFQISPCDELTTSCAKWKDKQK